MQTSMLAAALLLLILYMRRQWLQPGEVRAWREAKGWSQKKMADEISRNLPEDTLDLTLKTYQRWERGHTQPHPRNYQALQRVYLQQAEADLYHAMETIVNSCLKVKALLDDVDFTPEL